MQKVYQFTNENLYAYENLYNFDNAKVLTVLGSGDQYFTALLNGTKEATVFDINNLTWYNFVLKYIGIVYLSYEEFMKFFVNDEMNNLEIYQKLAPHLPVDVRSFFDKLLELKRRFSSIKINNTIFNNASQNNIPYLEKENYYKLQSILRENALPQFYCCNILDLPQHTKKSYDLMLLSNVYHYISLTAQEYYEFLTKFACPEIMALYSWLLNNSEKKEFLNAGFDVHSVNSVLNKGSKPDYIFSLSRKRV